ncbi:MAG: alpha/beta fold hydrolase [Chitinophagaceae bacterium]|nr:alpha/beta fold hydrolase [Chitinophagaceae bacterium]
MKTPPRTCKSGAVTLKQARIFAPVYAKKIILEKTGYWAWRVFLFYIITGTILYFMQEFILFRPKKLAADYKYSFTVPFKQIDLAVNEDKNLSIVQFTVPDSVRKGIVLYFHGNRGNINRYAPFAQLFTKNNYEVWMIDYPGYGKSTGKRTEQILYDDAHLFYKMAHSIIASDSIIIYGKSLGSAIATELASSRDCKQLILECPYYSMSKLAARYFFMFPTGPMMKFELPTYQYLSTVQAPVTILHGTKDGVIPYKHAVWLSEVKKGIELVTIEKGGHNDLADYPVFTEKIDSLLK